MTAIAQTLSAALLDFVWQGLLAAFLLWTTLFFLRNRSARARYAASCVGLGAMALLPAITAWVLYTGTGASQAPVGWVAAAPQTARAATGAAAGRSFDLARWALPLWSLGVLLFSLRLAWASRQISALRRQARPAEAAIRTMVEDLQERLQLARPVRVLVSAVADCPSVVGWMRPVVLLPAATVLGLTAQQLEAVLAHELAHILRYDYLVNMLQTVVETLLFYHPAVWWASARIRQERELCCDDLAVESCGDALCYARALTRLERLRSTTPRLALGSTGGSLLYRIQRMAGEAGGQRGPSKLPGILALSLGLICFGLNMQWARGQQNAPAPPVESGVTDEPGVRVDLGGAAVMHRAEVEYPDAAMEKGIQGTVAVEVTLDADGGVSDARVLSGPLELRKAALESVLQWHFTRTAAGTRQVSIAFELPPEGVAAKHSAEERQRKEEARSLWQAKREQDLVDATVKREIAEQARGIQSRHSADASELEAKEAQELAERVEEEDRVIQSRQSADSSELQVKVKKLVEALEKTKAQQKMGADELARIYAEQARAFQLLQGDQSRLSADEILGERRQMEELKARLAELQARSGELQARAGELQDGAIFAGRKLKSIHIEGLPSAEREQLLAMLPVHVGDTLTADSMENVEAAMQQFDEHLSLSMLTVHGGQVEIRITAPGSKSLEPPQ